MKQENVAKKIAWNTLIQSLGKILFTIFSAISVILLTRYLGQTGYGEITTVVVYVTFFIVWADLGLTTITVREISQNKTKTKKILGNILGMKLIISVLATLLAVVVVFLIPQYPPHIKLGVLISAVAITANLIGNVFSSIFQAKIKMQYQVMADITGRIVSIIAILIAIKYAANFYWVITNISIGALSSLVILLFFGLRLVKFKIQFSFSLWKELLLLALPLGIVVILNNVYFKVDTLLLSLLKPSSDVGIYGVSYRVLEMVLALGTFFVISVYPILAKLIHQNKKNQQTQKFIQRSFDILAMFIFPIIISILILAKPLIFLAGGQEFAKAVMPTQILIFGTLFSTIDFLFGQILIALNQQKSLLKIAIFILLFNVTLNLIFIPRYSYLAAASINVISEIVLLILVTIALKKYLSYLPRLDFLLKIILTMVPTAVMFWLINHFLSQNGFWLTALNVLVSLLGGLAIYLVMIYRFGLLKKEMVWALFKK